MALSNAVMDRIKAFAAKNPAPNSSAAGVKPAANPAPAVNPVRSQQEIIRRRQEAKGVMPVGTEPQQFYSRPDLDSKIKASSSELERLTPMVNAKKTQMEAAGTVYRAAEKNVYDLMGRAEQLAAQYSSQPSEETAAQYGRVYEEYRGALRSYAEARLGYERVYGSYSQMADAYNAVLTDFQNNMAEMDKWKGTVRDVQSVQQDLDLLKRNIAQQEKQEQDAAVALARQVQPGAYLQDAGATAQTPYGAALSQPDIAAKERSPRMQQLLDRQKLLLEELQWSERFAQEAENERWKQDARDVQTIQKELDDTNAQLNHRRMMDLIAAQPAQNQYAAGLSNPNGIQNATAPETQMLIDKKAQLETEMYWSRFNRYGSLAEKADFGEKSKYSSTANGKERQNPDGTWENTGFDDVVYEMINGNEEAVRRSMDNHSVGGRSTTVPGSGLREQMQDEEIALFNYLYATEGKEQAYVYLDWLKPELNKRLRNATEETARRYAQEHPFMSSLETVATMPQKALGFVDQFADFAGDGKIDQNAEYNFASHRSSAIREQVSKTIEESGKWGKAGSFAYQTALSMADFLFSTAITGGNGALSMAIMGTGAAADTVIAAKDRGLSDGQAFALGTVAGLAEAVTEKVSLDTLLDASLLKDNTLKYILKNMLAEGSEEVASDLINLAADIMISQDKSEWQAAVDAYMAEGMSESEALGKAFKDQMVTMGLDFLGGAISGGVMGGGKAAIQNRTTGKIGDFLAGANLAEEDIRVMVEEGLQSGPETDAYHIAKEVQQKLDAGKTVTRRDLGRLHQANMVAIDAEQRAQQEQEARAAEEPQGLRLSTLEDETAPAQQPGQNNTLNGGTRYADTYGQQPGAGVLPGGSQRYDGAGTPEQIRQLARRPGATEEDRRAKADRVRIAAERRNLVQDLRTGKVSAQSLGIARGTENASLQVIPEERWDEGMRQKAQQVYEETGKPVTYVAGAIEVQGTAGKTVTAKGMITDTGIVVRADHIEYSAEQIADHEAYHGMKDIYKGMRDGNGRTLEEAMVQRIRERYTPEAFDRVVEQYILALDGLMDVQGAETRQQYEARIEAVVEELLADAYAGMNMWNAGATQFTETVREFMEENNISRKPGAENGVKETTGPPADGQKESTAGDGGVIQYDGNGEVPLAVTFDSEEIKSATDNIGTFDGSNPDIRYSVDTISETEDGRQEEPVRADIAGQNVRAYANAHRQDLQQQEEVWRKRMREADRERLQGIKKPETESLPTIAKRDLRNTLMNQFSVPDGQRAELGSIIDSYADRLLKKGSLTEEDRQRLFDRMYDSGVMSLPADEYFETGRNMLRGGKVYVSDQIRQEFGDDWNDIRRRLFANKIYVTSNRDAGGIDSWNHELASLLPGLFHEEDTDLRDILERILYVAEQGREEKVSLAEYAARLAGQEYISERDFQENMERQMDWALRTFAEKAKLEIQLKDRTGAAVARERERGNQRLTWEHYRELQRQEKQRQDRQEKAEAAKARKELRELQQKTLKTLRWLNKNRKRAPEELRDTWDEVLGDIDLLAVGAANEMNWSDKYHATWRDLAQMYKDAQSNDPNFLPSDDLKNIVTRLDASKIGDMDLGALQDLYKAAVGLRTEFYNRNNLMNDEMHRLFAEVYEDIKGEMSAAPEKFTGKTADKFFNAEQLTPMNLMQRMGGWDPDGTFYSMAKQLEKGEKDMRRYHVQAQQMLQEFLEENQEWVKKADGQGKDAIWYELEVPELVQLNMGDKPIFGDTVKVAFTPAQKVHMYLESKNIDNLRHMTGGRTFADRKLYSEGKRQEAFAQGTTIRLAPETVKKIVSDLTEEEMALARLLEQYYNTFATGEINRVSNILNGYDKAMGKNYAPIYTNKNYNKTEFGVFDVTAEGVGNLKERQHSKNPSLNIGAFDAFERHVDHTARYVGMAIPVRNWNTLMNWRESHNSMGDVLTHKWGKEAKDQIEEIINALQAGEQFQKDSISTLAGKIQSNYISAIFGANPGIVLKQLGSIPMASAYLGAANAPKLGQLKNIDRELISKYTKELDWRLMGYATPETKQLKDNPNWSQSNKVFRFVFGGEAITAMDGWAASTLWPWAENKVRKEHPELEIGTQEQIDKGESPFYKKVAEEFENALSRSQSVSDEIHQSHLRKSKNPITRAFTMFRSDSAQTYNAIRQKIGEAQFYARTGAKEKAVKAAKRAVGEAFGAMLINASWASAVTFLMALWKNKAKNYRDDEDELTAASVAGEMISDMVGSMAGVAAGGEELYDFVGNILTGEKWYSFETPGMEQLNDLMEIIYESGSGMRDLIAGGLDIVNNGGDLGKYFDDHSGDILGNIKQIAAAAAQYVAGLPASNVEAYLLGSLKWVSPKLGAAYDDLFSDSGKASLAGMTGDALEGRIGSILDQRGISKAEDTASTLAGLYEAGHKAAMPGDVPASVSVDGEQRKLSPYQQQTYDAAWSSIVSEGLDSLVDSALFRSGDADLQEKMLKNLYSYATDKAKEAVFDGYMVQSATVQIAKLLKEDVSLSDVVAWRTVSSEMKTLEKMNLLKEWSIDPDAKAALVGSTLGWELQTETGKPTQYAKFLYSLENGMSVDEYLEVYTSGGNVDQYLEMMYEGVDHDAAQYYAEEVEDLVPLDAKGSVSDIQKWRVAIDASQKEEQQMTMLYILMNDSQYQKVEIAHSYGVKPGDYVRLQELLPEYDLDHSGGYKQTEIQAAINGLAQETKLTDTEKAALWQLVTGSTSSKKNPFGKKVGQKIIDEKKAAKDAPEEEVEDISFADAVMQQLMGR